MQRKVLIIGLASVWEDSLHRVIDILKKRKDLNDTSVVDITLLALSDLEDEESSTLDELFQLKVFYELF